MTNQDFFTVLYERTSNRAFNPEKEISKEDLHEILKAAGQAPSAWNLQHWKFLVFQGEDVQRRLHPIAYNQQQILDASAVVAILGDLEANKNVDPVFGPLVEKGYMQEDAKNRLAENIENAYKREQYPRDAAFSNASLAAMQLMLAAKAKGWDTCAIGGFNPQALVEEFNVSSRYTPIMLITIGEATLKGHPAPRMSVEEVTEWAK
ncbi:NAD(P)H nitroreductase [Bacillus manliponensis]|uniref:NAD(P)H nitroreductase n=1 Tax=Bacillus manliponensis TaxID=574376 RepID=A0A073K382_9BACI|nr:nitroreductase family protein [Bacillus manliponensis]KEK21031.1 NAD(P)H nitroreductase [Bacillus manliponensis]